MKRLFLVVILALSVPTVCVKAEWTEEVLPITCEPTAFCSTYTRGNDEGWFGITTVNEPTTEKKWPRVNTFVWLDDGKAADSIVIRVQVIAKERTERTNRLFKMFLLRYDAISSALTEDFFGGDTVKVRAEMSLCDSLLGEWRKGE